TRSSTATTATRFTASTPAAGRTTASATGRCGTSARRSRRRRSRPCTPAPAVKSRAATGKMCRPSAGPEGITAVVKLLLVDDYEAKPIEDLPRLVAKIEALVQRKAAHDPAAG